MEFQTNKQKDMKFIPNSTYSLSNSNVFEYADKETGEITQRISALFKPTYKRVPSKLAF